jgi:hypothetical protein
MARLSAGASGKNAPNVSSSASLPSAASRSVAAAVKLFGQRPDEERRLGRQVDPACAVGRAIPFSEDDLAVAGDDDRAAQAVRRGSREERVDGCAEPVADDRARGRGRRLPGERCRVRGACGGGCDQDGHRPVSHWRTLSR